MLKKVNITEKGDASVSSVEDGDALGFLASIGAAGHTRVELFGEALVRDVRKPVRKHDPKYGNSQVENVQSGKLGDRPDDLFAAAPLVFIDP